MLLKDFTSKLLTEKEFMKYLSDMGTKFIMKKSDFGELSGFMKMENLYYVEKNTKGDIVWSSMKGVSLHGFGYASPTKFELPFIKVSKRDGKYANVFFMVKNSDSGKVLVLKRYLTNLSPDAATPQPQKNQEKKEVSKHGRLPNTMEGFQMFCNQHFLTRRVRDSWTGGDLLHDGQLQVAKGIFVEHMVRGHEGYAARYELYQNIFVYDEEARGFRLADEATKNKVAKDSSVKKEYEALMKKYKQKAKELDGKFKEGGCNIQM